MRLMRQDRVDSEDMVMEELIAQLAAMHDQVEELRRRL